MVGEEERKMLEVISELGEARHKEVKENLGKEKGTVSYMLHNAKEKELVTQEHKYAPYTLTERGERILEGERRSVGEQAEIDVELVDLYCLFLRGRFDPELEEEEWGDEDREEVKKEIKIPEDIVKYLSRIHPEDSGYEFRDPYWKILIDTRGGVVRQVLDIHKDLGSFDMVFVLMSPSGDNPPDDMFERVAEGLEGEREKKKYLSSIAHTEMFELNLIAENLGSKILVDQYAFGDGSTEPKFKDIQTSGRYSPFNFLKNI